MSNLLDPLRKDGWCICLAMQSWVPQGMHLHMALELSKDLPPVLHWTWESSAWWCMMLKHMRNQLQSFCKVLQGTIRFEPKFGSFIFGVVDNNPCGLCQHHILHWSQRAAQGEDWNNPRAKELCLKIIGRGTSHCGCHLTGSYSSCNTNVHSCFCRCPREPRNRGHWNVACQSRNPPCEAVFLIASKCLVNTWRMNHTGSTAGD